MHHLVPAALQQLDLETTQLPYVNAKGMAYLRGNRIRLSDLASQLSSIYNLKSSEAGFSPNVLYNMTITQVSCTLAVAHTDLQELTQTTPF